MKKIRLIELFAGYGSQFQALKNIGTIGTTIGNAALRNSFKIIEKKCKQIGMLDIKGNECIRRVYSSDGLCPTLTSMQGGNRQPKIEFKTRIRRLTPKECFRLMGVKDSDADKMLAVNSASQCYKQAGNSIVIPVLEAIFRSILEII